MSLAGHGRRPTPLRRRASRPQLKRDPLGCSLGSSMLRVPFILAFALAACIGDRWWILRTSAQLPHPLSADCVRASLLGLPGVDSVRVEQRSASSSDRDSTVSLTDFGIVARGDYGGWVTHRTKVDNSVLLSTSWIVPGRKPAGDSIQNHKEIQSRTLRAVSLQCAGVEPRLKVVEGARL